MQEVAKTWSIALAVVLIKAAILMFAWGALANTFDLPTLSYGAAIGAILVVAMLVPVRDQKPEVKVVPVSIPNLGSEVDDILKKMRN